MNPDKNISQHIDADFKFCECGTYFSLLRAPDNVRVYYTMTIPWDISNMSPTYTTTKPPVQHVPRPNLSVALGFKDYAVLAGQSLAIVVGAAIVVVIAVFLFGVISTAATL